MITICSRWETHQMSPELEWRMWRQLRFFGITRFVFTPIVDELLNVAIEQYKTMEEALETCQGNMAFLEPKGIKTMNDLPCGDITLVLGNTSRHNRGLADPQNTYRIEPMGLDMYGINAASIALAYYYGQ